MTLTERFVNAAMRVALRLVCRLDVSELRRLPEHGPGFLMTNHTSNVEGPALYVFVQPRSATAMAKRELWHNPITRFIMQIWKTIPVDRGRVDKRAIRRCLAALDSGMFLGVAPEGTRSKTGSLGQGHPGIAMLASLRRVPIYPIAHTGFESMTRNVLRLRRPRITLRVGRPFFVDPPEGRPTPSQLRAITSEIMYQMARLLPPERRGHYHDLSKSTTEYLTFV